MEIFSVRLKWLREREGLSQQQIADKLGLSQSYYGRFERNKGEPNLETLAKLPEILKESIDFMIGLSDYLQVSKHMYDHFTRAADSIAFLKMDLESIQLDPHDRDIQAKDFDPNDKESVERKIAHIKKQIPLWEQRLDICREKLLGMLKDVPMISDKTMNHIKFENPWLDVIQTYGRDT